MGVDAVMQVCWNGPALTVAAVRDLEHDLCASFTGALCIFPGQRGLELLLGGKAAHDALTESERWDLQHPEVPGQRIAVHLMDRYYAPGYERGDCIDLCAIADWFRRRLPGCVVLYGSDSGDHLSVMDTEEMLNHFAQHGHEPYRRRNTDGAPDCKNCQWKMYHIGSWGTISQYSCHGCGATVEFDGKEFKEMPRLKRGFDGNVRMVLARVKHMALRGEVKKLVAFIDEVEALENRGFDE